MPKILSFVTQPSIALLSSYNVHLSARERYFGTNIHNALVSNLAIGRAGSKVITEYRKHVAVHLCLLYILMRSNIVRVHVSDRECMRANVQSK